jgi:hypothetical protein
VCSSGGAVRMGLILHSRASCSWLLVTLLSRSFGQPACWPGLNGDVQCGLAHPSFEQLPPTVWSVRSHQGATFTLFPGCIHVTARVSLGCYILHLPLSLALLLAAGVLASPCNLYHPSFHEAFTASAVLSWIRIRPQPGGLLLNQCGLCV